MQLPGVSSSISVQWAVMHTFKVLRGDELFALVAKPHVAL